VQQLQTQPITQYNQHQSLSIICIEAQTDIDLKRVMLPSSLLLSGLERECNVATYDSITITWSLSYQLCYESFIEYRHALSLTKRRRNINTHTHTRKWNRSMTQEQQPYARVSMSKLCSTCHTHTANRWLIDALWHLIWASPLWYLHHCVWVCVPQWVWVRVSTSLIHAIKQPLATEILTQSLTHSVSIRLINR